MNGLIAIAALSFAFGVSFLIPQNGPSALLLSAPLAVGVLLLLNQYGGPDRVFLQRVFSAALLVRMMVGTGIYYLRLQEFFGGDAMTYDYLGYLMSLSWAGQLNHVSLVELLGRSLSRNWGMTYLVGAIYTIVGRNMLAVQYFNAVLGAATAPIIYLCAQHIFSNLRVARTAAVAVAFYPSLVLWSSQGLKDGPIVFLLSLIMLASFTLGERITIKHAALLGGALFALLTLRFYIFYMALAAVGGAFLIGMRPHSAQSVARHVVIAVGIGLALTYVGVLRTASAQLEYYGNLENVQVSRADMATSANSGFGRDVDVSTTEGALSAIPVGLVYLLFAPFPWQLGSLRQMITLPEMLIWWASFPALVIGGWFTIRVHLRRALPILLFTMMLTLAYSLFQGNVGTAYRQRSQLLVFYFIFVAVGAVLVREKRENRKRQLLLAKHTELVSARRERELAFSRTLPPRPRLRKEESVVVGQVPTGGGAT